jgi:hypothetical protein
MNVNITGFQDASRIIEARIQGLVNRARTVIQREVDETEAEIRRQLAYDGVEGFLESDSDENSFTIELRWGIEKNNSARWQHNPKRWDKAKKAGGINLHQPFQDVLASRGYTDISPARGEPIDSDGSRSAPNVRVSARLPERVIQEIINGL